MKTLNLNQGSEAWHIHRSTARNASDAPAVLGCSPYQTRAQLLHARYTGIRPEVDAAQQRRFDDGHAIEAAQLPFAEKMVRDSLYAVVGSEVVDGIELSASFDGLTLFEDMAYECKTLNDKLREALPNAGLGDNDAFNLPKMYRVQMEQQLMVSGAGRVLFVAASKDGQDVRCCWYESDWRLRDEIIAAWKQFDADLAAYVPPAQAVPEATGHAPETLPALFITVRGEVTDSNLANFKDVALRAIRSVNRDLQNDQDFADADLAVKWCSDIEKRVQAAKEHALSQTATIDQLFKTMDDISAEARKVRLDLSKLVTERKATRKCELLIEAQGKMLSHTNALNARLGNNYIPKSVVDFAGAIRGKSSFTSMAAALDAALANAKIEANATADRIDTNLKFLNEHAADYKALFADTAQLVLKPADDFQALVRGRIAEHQATVQRQAEAAAEKAREAIRAEERAKAEKEAQKQALAQAERAQVAIHLIASEIVAPAVAPSDNVVVLPVRSAPTADLGTMIKLGELNAMLAPIALTADGLALLGYPAAATEKNAKLYRTSDIGHICAALVAHIQAVQARQAA